MQTHPGGGRVLYYARVVVLLIVHVILCIRSKRAQKYKVGNITQQQQTRYV